MVISFTLDSDLMKPNNLTKGQIAETNAYQTRMHCAHGLAELVMSRYKSAAINFLLCTFDHCENLEILSTHNVTIYGVLCAMASFNRNELYQKVNFLKIVWIFLDNI